MTRFAHVNLLDIEDSVAGRADGLELIAVGGPKPEGGDGEPVPVTWP